MTLILPRRQFLLGLGAALAAPAIVRFESLMPVRAPIDWEIGYTYEWFRNGVLIAGATSSELNLTAVHNWESGDGIQLRETVSWNRPQERFRR